MSRILPWSILALALITTPAIADDDDLLLAIRLPAATRDARALGVPDRDVREILASAREHRVRPGSITELFRIENESIRQHGPIDNFGAVVQQKLDAGLRGRDLARAIQAEHATRGKGAGAANSNRPADPGKSGAHGKPADPGKSGDYGKPDDHGKPADPGKSDEHGKPADPGKSNAPGKKGGTR